MSATAHADTPRALWALRLSDQERADLDHAATALGISRSDVVRLGIAAVKEGRATP